MGFLKFDVICNDGEARAGKIETLHGSFNTPLIYPVGTAGSVKALTPKMLKEIGIEAILANTYHLMIKSDPSLIEKIGGIHRFMGWDRPVVTDSGGFQVFSLGFGIDQKVSKIGNFFPGEIDEAERKKFSEELGRKKSKAKVDDEGATFISPTDGSRHRLTPEKSIKIQEQIGADIIFVFDECTSLFNDHDYTRKSMERTHRWAERCVKAHKSEQALFGIIQGGAYKDLREISAEFIASLDLDGYGIGGALGDTKEEMHDIIRWCMPYLDRKKPVHLLGIGGVDDIIECVELGIDIFDCVTPTRLARMGYYFIRPESGGCRDNKWRCSIRSSANRESKEPLDSNCSCYVCSNFSKAYLMHLFKNKELLIYTLLSYHNLAFFKRLVDEIREAIKDKRFSGLKERWLK